MALAIIFCLNGCEAEVPNADYTFPAKEFVNDCIEKHGSNYADSLVEAEKFYCNKRIIVKGGVMANKKDADFAVISGGELGREGKTTVVVLRIAFRDEADRQNFEAKEYVKVSARFMNCTFNTKNPNVAVLTFDFDDGIFLGKL